MATVTLTLADTESGSISMKTDYKPAIGHPCTPAQGYSLEIINRTHKQWGLKGTPPITCQCTTLQGEQAVLVRLLNEADQVISTIMGDTAEDDEKLEQLRAAIAKATAPHRKAEADLLSGASA